MLITEEVMVVWGARTKTWFVDKGYTFTKFGESVKVKTKDLLPQSSVYVGIQCDYCNKIFEKVYSKYLSSKDEFGKDSCKECKRKKFGDFKFGSRHNV